MARESHLTWKVKYAPGKLEAFAVKNGRKLYAKVETTGAANKILLSPDRKEINADGEDVCVMNVSVLDDKGREIPDAMNLLEFDMQGNAKIIGVGNGDPSSHEPDKCMDGKWQRKLFNGKCQVIVQSDGGNSNIKFTASGEGLTTANINISTKAVSTKTYVLEKPN